MGVSSKTTQAKTIFSAASGQVEEVRRQAGRAGRRSGATAQIERMKPRTIEHGPRPLHLLYYTMLCVKENQDIKNRDRFMILPLVRNEKNRLGIMPKMFSVLLKPIVLPSHVCYFRPCLY